MNLASSHFPLPPAGAGRHGIAPERAFTLVELLVVVGVMVVMMTLSIPAFNAIRGGADFSSEVYDISGALEQARAYAMANNTYVLAGIIEVSNTLSTAANPQPAVAAGTVGGRITMAVVASTTGARPYNASTVTDLSTFWGNTYYKNGLSIPSNSSPTVPGGVPGGGFVAVSKLMSFQNIHLIDLQTSPMPASGGMARPPVSQYYDIPNANCYSGAGFAWPLGTYLSGGTPLAQYYFNRNGTYNLLPKVIEFDPQGSARIITTQPSSTSALLDAIPQYIEIGLEPSHGAVAAAAPADQVHNPGQIAAIQIDGMSGAIRTYRP